MQFFLDQDPIPMLFDIAQKKIPACGFMKSFGPFLLSLCFTQKNVMVHAVS